MAGGGGLVVVWFGGDGGRGSYEEGGDCDAGADAEDGCHFGGGG